MQPEPAFKTPADVIAHYDAINRQRSLTDAESLIVEKAVNGWVPGKKRHCGCGKRIDWRNISGRCRPCHIRSVTPPSAWTEDMDATLMDAIADGKTFSQAGLMLGRSNNACIGRYHRIIAAMGEQAQ